MTFKLFLAISIFVVSATGENLEDEQDPTKIVGGEIADRGEFPFVAGLWIKNGRRPFCGGSVISNRWMITAAHCVYKKRRQLEAVLGDHDVRTAEPGEKRISICSKHIHPGYEKKRGNDIALVKFCKPVQFSASIQPISLFRPGDDPIHGASVTVAGWGTRREGGRTSPLLRFVNVRVIGQRQCRRAYPWVGGPHLCAGLSRGGKDACQGDSGGPLWILDAEERRRILVGVVSSGKGCARGGYPGIYTSVAHHFSWIIETMGSQ